VEAWEALHTSSREHPHDFFDEAARELEWMRPWDSVREGPFPHFKYFVGGVSNPTLNLLDRHLARGADNRLALIWEGEDGQTRFFTYRMLLVEVSKCANVLKSLGVGKGDAVAIFTPNLSEAIVAVLASFRTARSSAPCSRVSPHGRSGPTRIMPAEDHRDGGRRRAARSASRSRSRSTKPSTACRRWRR
jgi:non-ribosomal peptide synthetase component F